MSGTKVIHRFIRNANIDSNIHNRIANRFAPFTNTLVTLNDPADQRTLTLIAHRTRILLDKLKPDAVYVQTSKEWWQHAQHTDIDNQKLFTEASKCFPQESYKFQNNMRGILFRLRYLIWKYTFDVCLRLSDDFQVFTPGLQAYYACKYASNNSVPNYFGGDAFDPITLEGLRLEPDLYPHTFLWKGFRNTYKVCNSWTSQYDDFMNVLHVRGGEAFAESIDRSRINFIVAILNKVAPKQKGVLIDQRDERIFRDLHGMKGHKNIVALVNHWHMEGVETHWRRSTGTVIEKPQLSPVADMNIDAMQQKSVINEWLREYTSGAAKTEPATWQDYLTNYHKENFENERTRHTHHDSHEDIPQPGEKAKHHH